MLDESDEAAIIKRKWGQFKHRAYTNSASDGIGSSYDAITRDSGSFLSASGLCGNELTLSHTLPTR